MKKFIILDRDGVINYDSNEYIKNPDEWHAIPGSLVAIAQLNRAGYHVFVATNQSGVGRHYYDVSLLDRIHEKMLAELAAVGGHIDGIVFCPHLPSDNCSCRKPKPGMLYQIRDKYQVNLSEVFFIGDKLTDLEAARTAGCKPILISSIQVEDVPCFPNLTEAVHYVIDNSLSQHARTCGGKDNSTRR